MEEISIERLIPQRDRMKLVETIVHVDQEKAVTEALVNNRWPLWAEGTVSPIILIELMAQTAAVHFGYQEISKGSPLAGREGWIVGIKRAEFHVDEISDGTRIVTTAEIEYNSDNYAVYTGNAFIGSSCAGEAVLQVFRPDKEEEK